MFPQKKSKLFLGSLFTLTAVFLAGCKENSADNFLGKWEGEEFHEGSDYTRTTHVTLDVTTNDIDNYLHINEIENTSMRYEEGSTKARVYGNSDIQNEDEYSLKVSSENTLSNTHDASDVRIIYKPEEDVLVQKGIPLKRGEITYTRISE